MAAKPKKPASRGRKPTEAAPKKGAGGAARTGAAAKRGSAAKPAPKSAAKATPKPRKGAPAASPRRRKPVVEREARSEAPPKAGAPVRGDGPDVEADPTATAKLAIGPGADARETPSQIPWSYGQDRVTAAAVDPERLFVYWEVTDPAIERARRALGKGGPGAWLCLRVYDTTGLIFDGTNAHSYFDHAIDRTTRQWFFHVGKPTSTAFVELGMKSSEGYFAKIVRSGRVDFPRRVPAPWGDPEWMTVRPWSGEVADVHRSPAPPPGGGGASPAPGAGRGEGESFWVMREPGGVHESVLRELIEGGWERIEWSEAGGERWYALEGRIEWESPRSVTSWEAGPFADPVEVEPPHREVRSGQGSAYRVGSVTHVVDGPWRVVISNLGPRTGRQVIATWEIHRSWSLSGGWARRAVTGRGGIGASELRWGSASEQRLGGASERWRIGASELAWRGASERIFAGASQWRYAGGSERAFAGGSEYRLGGASERGHAGGSEGRLGGSEARFDGPTAPPLPYPPAGKE